MMKRFVPKMLEVRVTSCKDLKESNITDPAEMTTECGSSSRDLDVVKDSITTSRSRHRHVQSHSFL